MIISLPDGSIVHLIPGRLSFLAVDITEVARSIHLQQPDIPFGIDIRVFEQYLSNPIWRFGDCFRRVSDHPRYSPKGSVHSFDVNFITKIYKFSGSYQGGTFCPSTTEWKFLDGGIISHNGYGWGSHSWTVVEGYESIRAVCLLLGIQQPRRMKGEKIRRPLSIILQELSSAPLQEDKRRLWNLPDPLKLK